MANISSSWHCRKLWRWPSCLLLTVHCRLRQSVIKEVQCFLIFYRLFLFVCEWQRMWNIRFAKDRLYHQSKATQKLLEGICRRSRMQAWNISCLFHVTSRHWVIIAYSICDAMDNILIQNTKHKPCLPQLTLKWYKVKGIFWVQFKGYFAQKSKFCH